MGSRKIFLESRNKLVLCAFEIGFFTIIFIDNQKLKKIKTKIVNQSMIPGENLFFFKRTPGFCNFVNSL